MRNNRCRLCSTHLQLLFSSVLVDVLLLNCFFVVTAKAPLWKRTRAFWEQKTSNSCHQIFCCLSKDPVACAADPAFLTLLRGGDDNRNENVIIVSENEDDKDQSSTVLPYELLLANPFVQAAPLILAAACGDGSVAVVAVHSQGGREEMEEPLLYHDQNDGSSLLLNVVDIDNDRRQQDFGGPYRILGLGQGLALLCIGWRADCDLLADRAREWVRSEQIQFGCGHCDNVQSGYVLATQLSLHLAGRVVESVGGGDRPLSCAAMVISPSSNNNSAIWWTDETGVYPVRALAVGREAAKVNAQLVQQTPLQHHKDGRQGLRSLLSALKEAVLLPNNHRARVELAIVQPPAQGLLIRRVGLRDLDQEEEPKIDSRDRS